MMPVAKCPDIALDALDRFGGCANLIHFNQFVQGTDGRAALDNRTRPDIARPHSEIGSAMSDLFGRENIGSGVQIADGIEKSTAANVVSADHKYIERIERHIGKKRRRSDNANRRLDAAQWRINPARPCCPRCRRRQSTIIQRDVWP